MKVKKKMFRLPNGLCCYVVQNMETNNDISIQLLVRAGALQEKKGERGWFHFLEHLLIYPHLYPAPNRDADIGFKAFDYAYVSFCETAYLFQGSDGTGELLRDSFRTARGILEGSFLSEMAFLQTKGDVLKEYESFTRKRWFASSVNLLNSISASLPIGSREDISKVGYGKLIEKHKQAYRMENAAIIVSSSRSAEEIQILLQQVFQEEIREDRKEENCHREWRHSNIYSGKFSVEEPYLFLAWLPRQAREFPKLVQEHVHLAILARALELGVLDMGWKGKAECTVEIFHANAYLFCLALSEKFQEEKSAREIRGFVQNLFLTKSLFLQAKEVVSRQLDKQEHCPLAEAVSECREHFLYGEPFLGMEEEFYCTILANCKYEDVRNKFRMITDFLQKE